MYYIKLQAGQIIPLSAQARDSARTSTSTSGTTINSTSTSSEIAGSITCTTASTITTTTTTTVNNTASSTESKTVTFALEAVPSRANLSVPATGWSKSKSKVSDSTSLPAKNPRRRRISTLTPGKSNIDSGDIKLESFLSPSRDVNTVGTSGGAAAARLIDLGKQLLGATREGQKDVVRQLIVDSGAPFTSDWLGTTALHVAAQNGFVEIAEILLTSGVNRDAKTKLDRTALHVASQSGSVEIVDLLISNGADVDARDMLKMTPLHWAVERGHASVVERLLVAGSDINAKNKFQLTPIDIARGSKCCNIISLFNSWTGIETSLISRSPYELIDTSGNNNMFQQPLQTNCISSSYDQDLDRIISFEATRDDLQSVVRAANCKNQLSMHKNQQQQQTTLNSSNGNSGLFSESHDFLDTNHLSIDFINGEVDAQESGASNCRAPAPSKVGNVCSIEEKCIDFVEYEWNNLDIVPELFMPTNDNDDCESNVEYLMKIVEELQKENKQLRQQVEQLSTTSP